jgi:hypothetical protein
MIFYVLYFNACMLKRSKGHWWKFWNRQSHTWWNILMCCNKIMSYPMLQFATSLQFSYDLVLHDSIISHSYILAWVLTINQKQYSECRAIKKCHLLFDPLYWQISLRSKQHAIFIYFLSICLGSSLCSVPIVTFVSIRPIYTTCMISECNLQLAYLVVISGLLHKEIKGCGTTSACCWKLHHRICERWTKTSSQCCINILSNPFC